MKVNELIGHLQLLKPDNEVLIHHYGLPLAYSTHNYGLPLDSAIPIKIICTTDDAYILY